MAAKAAGYYRDFFALKDVSFQVRKGESVGIIGRNGSGKSTLLQILAGTIQPTNGNVKVNGRVAALLELGSGFNPDFTGRENVYLNAAILGLSKSETDSRFEEIAAFADIGDFLEQPVKTYSSGMLMRLAFAVQTAVNAEVLIVDEALAVGDEAFQRKCFARMDSLRAAGTTVLVVTHGMATVIEICERAILLHGGTLLLAGKPKTVAQQYHRLIYAPPERVSGIVAEMSSVRSIDTPLYNKEDTDTNRRGSITGLNIGEECFFDPRLVSCSMLAYESRGARIVNSRIQTSAGHIVNSLVKRDVYYYCYEVHFDRICRNVRVAHVFKTLSGVELGGTTLRSTRFAIPVAQPGQVAAVRIRFRCLLNAGTYLANSGVLALDNESETYMHRIVDAAIFRVLPDVESNFSCYVDLDFEPSVVLVSPTATAGDRL